VALVHRSRNCGPLHFRLECLDLSNKLNVVRVIKRHDFANPFGPDMAFGESALLTTENALASRLGHQSCP
jgi:hypothetical protein